jgi:hypothetical protein
MVARTEGGARKRQCAWAARAADDEDGGQREKGEERKKLGFDDPIATIVCKNLKH